MEKIDQTSAELLPTLQVPNRSPSRRSGFITPPSPDLRRRPESKSFGRSKQRERADFFFKFSPLSSKDLFANQRSSQASQTKPFVLDPTGRKAYNWLLIVSAAVMYFTWSIVLRFSFLGFQEYWLLWLLLDTISHIVYAADFWMQTRTSYLQDGILEEDLERMRAHYQQHWQFYIDLACALPLDWLYIVMRLRVPPLFIHCPKLLKLYRLKQLYERTESRSHFPNICRVIFLLHNMIVIIHWNACLYFSLSQWIGFGSDTWVYPTWNSTHNSVWGDLSRQYIYSFYWSALTLTTIGELPQPQTNLEYVVVICDYLIGILMFATIVGNVGNIITNTQKHKTKFQSKMDSVKVYMKQTKVPEHLREKVIKWFDYLWTHGHPMDDQQALNALPEKLKAEIGIYVHFETLKKVDFFSICEPGLLWELVVRLRTQVYSPAEYVCKKGDVGREMYIVNSGKLEVTADEDGVVLKELIHGDYFGEISVLNLGMGKNQRRRTAFVRSVGFSTLLCLTQGDLLDVLKDYPQTMDMLVDKGKKKLSRDIDGEAMAEEETKIEHKDERRVGDSDDEQRFVEDFSDQRKMSISSNDSSVSYIPMEMNTVADQVSDLHIKIRNMEGLMVQLLQEVRESRNTPKQQPMGTLSKITERIRKVSAF